MRQQSDIPLYSAFATLCAPSVIHPEDETSLEAGIRVQIHSQDEPPYIHQLGFGVSPGFQTFVSCQEQRVGRLHHSTPSPTSPPHHQQITTLPEIVRPRWLKLGPNKSLCA